MFDGLFTVIIYTSIQYSIIFLFYNAVFSRDIVMLLELEVYV